MLQTNTNEIVLVNLKEKLATTTTTTTKLSLNGTKDFKSTTKSISSHHNPLRHIKVDVYLIAIQNDNNILNLTNKYNNNNNKLIQRWLFSMRTTERDDAFRKRYLLIN